MVKINVTAERVRELLNYDPETGIFTWRESRGPVESGSIAGSLSSDGYIVIRVDWGIYKAGRLAWVHTYGCWPEAKIRYLDFDRTNNRISNLTTDPSKIPKKPRPELTADLLRQILTYHPITGLFYRVKDGSQYIGDTTGRYIRMQVLGKRYQAHRLAWLWMKGEWPENQIDHKDRVKHNNIWTNLRNATIKQNQENITTRPGTSSGVTGVSWVKATQAWQVTLMTFGKRIYIGKFDSLEDAVNARKQAERKYFTHSPVCEPQPENHENHVLRHGIEFDIQQS